MSGANAVSGITIVGALIIAGSGLGLDLDRARVHRHRARDDERGRRLCRHRPHAGHVSRQGSRRSANAALARRRSSISSRPFSSSSASSASISPPRRGAGNQISLVGMLLAMLVTLLDRAIVSYWVIVAGVVVGTALGPVAGLRRQDDGDAADGGACSTDLAAAHRCSSARAEFLRAYEADALIPTPTGVVMQRRSARRRRHAHRQPGRVCQAPGDDAGRPITFPGQNAFNALAVPRDCRACRRGRCPPRSRSSCRSICCARLSLRARRAARHPDRRRGHAGRDFAAELLFRDRGGHDRLRDQQRGADHLGRARRARRASSSARSCARR